MRTIHITARYQSGGQTYVAGPVRGKTASATSGPEPAVQRLAHKLFGDAVRGIKQVVQPLPGDDLYRTSFAVLVDEVALANPANLPALAATQGARA